MSYTKIVDLIIDGKKYSFQMEGKDWYYYSEEEHKQFQNIKTMKELREFLYNKFKENRCGSVIFGNIEEKVEDEIKDFLIQK